MRVTITEGDLLDQPTEGIVNAENRNIIPQRAEQLMLEAFEAIDSDLETVLVRCAKVPRA